MVSSPAVLRTKTCKKCGLDKEYPEGFAKASKPGRDGLYRLGHCRECHRAVRRAWRARDPERHRADDRRYRAENAERVREHDRKYNRSEAGRSRLRKYNNGPKGKRAHARYRKKKREELRKLGVRVPVQVIAPYVEQLRVMALAHIDFPEGDNPGLMIVSRWTGVDESLLSKILQGKKRTVTLQTIDLLAMHGDFTVDEIYERAAEWAHLTGDSWPDGYRRG